MISKAILVQARPPGSATGMYGLRRISRKIRYSKIAYTSCAGMRACQDRPSHGASNSGCGSATKHGPV